MPVPLAALGAAAARSTALKKGAGGSGNQIQKGIQAAGDRSRNAKRGSGIARDKARQSKMIADRRQNPINSNIGRSPHPPPNPSGKNPDSLAGRKAALARSQSGPLLSRPEAQSQSGDTDEEREGESDQEGTLASLRRTALAAKAKSGEEDGNKQAQRKGVDAATEEAQKAAKKLAKQAIPRGASFIANTLASALNLGTYGIALIVTFLVYLFSLGWLNVEMILGGWVFKGKHPIISPLQWSPIPMPIDNNPKTNSIFLTACVLAADLVLIILAITVLTTVLLIIFIFMDIVGAISTFGVSIIKDIGQMLGFN